MLIPHLCGRPETVFGPQDDSKARALLANAIAEVPSLNAGSGRCLKQLPTDAV
jgi:hypothetical protein